MKKGLVVLATVALLGSGLFGRPASAAAGVVLGGGNAHDVIAGTPDDDILFGKGGADKLLGRGGSDLIFGGGGADLLDGGEGDDTIVDDDGRAGDVLRGRGGSDVLYSLDGAADTVNCGAGGGIAFADGNDTVRNCRPVIRRSGEFHGFRVRVAGNTNSFLDKAGRAVMDFGRRGNDILRGSDDDDIIFGGANGDIMQGFDGADLFVDDDTMANDSIQAGKDADVTYMADGARGTVDCDPNNDNGGEDDVVFADPDDSVLHCGHVHRIAAF